MALILSIKTEKILLVPIAAHDLVPETVQIPARHIAAVAQSLLLTHPVPSGAIGLEQIPVVTLQIPIILIAKIWN